MVSRTFAISAASMITILVVSLVIGAVQTPQGLDGTLLLDATYYKNDGLVVIIFEDKSNKTSLAVLEVLGMDTSFQRHYTGANFTQHVKFDAPPKLGWKVHPVTVAITHDEFGQIGIKTEIHEPGSPKPPIIYGCL